MNTKGLNIKPRASTYEKERNNFERQIAIIDDKDTFYGTYRDDARLGLYRINYDLMNGRLDTSLYSSTELCNINGEKVTFSEKEIPHVPLICQVTNTLRGEQFFRPWKLTVEDDSPLKNSIEGEEYLKLLKEYVNLNIIQPKQQEVMSQFLSGIDEETLASLPPDQLEEIQNEAAMQSQALNPKEIQDFMTNEYLNPIAKQASEVINHLDKELELREKQLEGFTHMLPTAEEIYFVYVGDDGLIYESVPPDAMTYGGPPEEEWVQKMDWARRERWTTVTDIKFKYAEVLKEEHLKELDDYYEPLFGTSNYANAVEKRYQYEISIDPEGVVSKYGNQDSRHKENFGNILNAHESIQRKWGGNGDVNLSEYAIREAHFVWKDERIMYKVYRKVDNKLKKFYFAENYRKTAEDIFCKKITVPEIWEGTKIGTNNPIYLNIRPLKYQYKDIDNPYDVELPYVGKKYNILKNRTKNVSIIDLMKQFQRDYDTEMATLRRDLRTNVGKVFVMLINSKPKNMSWSDTVNVMKDFNLLLIDNTQKGSAGVDPQFFKDIDMSKMVDIQNRLLLLEKIHNDLYAMAGFSSHRLGQGSQYASNLNIQQQQASSYNQTETMFETHRLIVEKSLNRLMNIARMYYKDHPEELKNVLSPSSMMELEYGYPFWYSHFNMRLETSGRTSRQIDSLKQHIQAFIQNSMKPRDVIEFALAENKSELNELLNRMDKETEAQMNLMQENQQKQLESQTQAQLAEKDAERQFKIQLAEMNNQASVQRTIIDSETFAKAQDINRNNQSDLIEAKKLDLVQKNKEHEDKIELEYAKLSKS